MVQSRFLIEDRRARGLRGIRVLSLMFGMFMAGSGYASTSGRTAKADMKLNEPRALMTVGASRFNVILSDSDAARAFHKLLPLTLKMEELNGNEKHGELPKPLPSNASRPGTIRRGDLMLYGARTLVVFYATFDSSYSYTRLGRVDDPAGLAEALGRDDARVSFSTR